MHPADLIKKDPNKKIKTSNKSGLPFEAIKGPKVLAMQQEKNQLAERSESNLNSV